MFLFTFNLAQRYELVNVAHDVYALLRNEQVVSEQASESPKPDTRGRKEFISLSSRSLQVLSGPSQQRRTRLEDAGSFTVYCVHMAFALWTRESLGQLRAARLCVQRYKDCGLHSAERADRQP